MKVSKIAFVTAIFVFVSAFKVYAGSTGFVTDNSVNVRIAPSTNSDIIATINNGHNLEALSVEGDFIKVLYQGRNAYIHKKYFKVTKFQGVITGDSINVRGLPSTDASVLGKLGNGTDLVVQAVIGDWYQVTYNGSPAYIHKDYLSVPFKDELKPITSAVVQATASMQGAQPVVAASAQPVAPVPSAAPVQPVAPVPTVAQADAAATQPAQSELQQAAQAQQPQPPLEAQSQQPQPQQEAQTQLSQGAQTQQPQLPQEALMTQAQPFPVITDNQPIPLQQDSMSLPVIPIQPIIPTQDFQPQNPAANQPENQGAVPMSFDLGQATIDGQAVAATSTVVQEGIPNQPLPVMNPQNPDVNSTSDDFHEIPDGDVVEAPDLDALYAIVTPSNGLNLRLEPSLESPIFYALPYDSVVDVIEIGDQWCKVSYGGQLGYVATEFIVIGRGEKPTRDVANNKATEIIDFAKRYLGTPYVWGGSNLSRGVDCSGFVYSVYKNFGLTLYRSSRTMVNNGYKISKSDLTPGDLVFFDTEGSNNGSISHVGIYIGNGNFIHSSSSKRTWGVVITSLSDPYYIRTYVTATRVLK